MHADPGLTSAAFRRATPSPLAAFGYVALSIVGVLCLFWPTTRSMVETWRIPSGTYQHCFLVFPVALWLIWGKKEQLAATPLRPFWPGIGLVASLGAIWLLGVFAEAPFVSQFALVGLACAFVWTVCGTGWARLIWFPLAFMFFAVPFGEVFVPRLMDWTADITVASLRLSAVPVYREGTHFVIPTGQWSVIESCSGIKFLIASITGGSLYAWLMYRSPGKRAAFLAASIVVPLLANWLRAYLIVLIGHLSNNRYMTHDDHIVFGWVLFGAIMLAMYWIGARWREDEPGPPYVASPPHADDGSPVRPVIVAFLAAAAVVAAWPIASKVFLAIEPTSRSSTIAMPEAMAGWNVSSGSWSDWQPDLIGAPERASFVFRKGGRTVGLFVAAYRNQTQESQLATSANQFVSSENRQWKQTSRGDVATGATAGVAQAARSASVVRRGGAEELIVWQWYWVGRHATSSDLRGKWNLAMARVTLQPDAGLWVAIYAPADRGPEEANAALREFVREMDSSLAASFERSVAR